MAMICERPFLINLIRYRFLFISAQLSRLAYIRDDELHQIYLNNLGGENKCLQKPAQPTGTKDPKLVKYVEIYDAIKKFAPSLAPPPSHGHNSTSSDDIFFSADEERG